MKILLAEDDYMMRKSMEAFLSKYGFVDIAVDGMEAVDAYVLSLEDGDPYELVCLDVMMPVLSGYQALERIRIIEKNREVKPAAIIFMTTVLDMENNISQAYELGCNGYLNKPVDAEKFEKLLDDNNLDYRKEN